MRTRALLLALFVLASAVFPSHALAAAASTATTAPAPPLTRVPGFEVELWPEAQPQTTVGVPASSVLIVVALLSTGTPLPATVRLPLPKGAKVTWAGEVLSGGVQSDIQRPYKVVAGTGGDVVELAVGQSYAIQYEADYTAPTVKDGRSTLTLDWVQSAPPATAQFAVRLPLTADDVKTDPPFVGQPAESQSGEKLYVTAQRSLSQGQAFKLTASYARASSSASAVPVPRSGGGGDYLLPLLLGILGIVVVVLIVLMVRQRSAGRAEGGDGSDAPPGLDEPDGDASADEQAGGTSGDEPGDDARSDRSDDAGDGGPDEA